VLVSIFGMPIYTYGTFLAVAFIIAIILARWDAAKKGIPPDIVVDIALALCIGGFIGGRLLFVLLDAKYYWHNPWEIIDTRAGGMSFIGGAFAGFGTAWWYVVKKKKLAPWPLADLCVPYAALGYALARVGCFLRGCCYGMPAHLPWAMACKAGDPLTPRHPTQLYASLGSLLLFFFLFKMRKHERFPGFLFFLGMGLYAVMRGVIEAFRDSEILWAGVRLTQVVCLAMLVYAVLEIIRRERHWMLLSRRGEEDGEEVDRPA
jgi:phosphatidylglycerol:prolipoprotein diacylglycerol transferase